MKLLIQQIDFNQLNDAIPNLDSKFKLGAAGVYPILSDILKYVYVFGGLLLLFYIIYGGFHMILASGDEKGLIEAKGKITNALIGFIILFVAYWLVQILEIILGVTLF